jgi:hypothetical protein
MYFTSSMGSIQRLYSMGIVYVDGFFTILPQTIKTVSPTQIDFLANRLLPYTPVSFS